jgi:hypothetical protein
VPSRTQSHARQKERPPNIWQHRWTRQAKHAKGAPSCDKDADFTQNASSRGAGSKGRSTHDPWDANGAPLVTSAHSPLGAMEKSQTRSRRNPRNMDIPLYSRHSWSWDTWRKSKKACSRGEDFPALEAKTRTGSARWRWSAERGQGKRNTSNLCSKTASSIAAKTRRATSFGTSPWS